MAFRDVKAESPSSSYPFCSRVSSLPRDLVFQLPTDPFLDTSLIPTPSAFLRVSCCSHWPQIHYDKSLSDKDTFHIYAIVFAPGLQSGQWTVVVLLNRKMNELTNFQIWPKFAFQLWRIIKDRLMGAIHYCPQRTRNLSAHAAPVQPRITYQDLHRLSQTLHHLLIIFILLLRLGQQSRELCHSKERSTALSPGQPKDMGKVTQQHTSAPTRTLPLQLPESLGYAQSFVHPE